MSCATATSSSPVDATDGSRLSAGSRPARSRRSPAAKTTISSAETMVAVWNTRIGVVSSASRAVMATASPAMSSS